MISDVLHDAIVEIDRYLSDPVMGRMYEDPDTAAMIVDVRARMDALRARLDAVAPEP